MTTLRAVLSVTSLAAILLASGCDSSVVTPAPCEPDHVCVTGTVRFFSFEGGFWAVRGDDNVTYDPLDGLPTGFRRDGLRVYLVAKERPDAIGFHMAGPIVEIVSIQRLD
jgi:hypothetical protein